MDNLNSKLDEMQRIMKSDNLADIISNISDIDERNALISIWVESNINIKNKILDK